jgi:hypothetical protein
MAVTETARTQRTTAEVLYRDVAGRKQCKRCSDWLPEDRFGADGRKCDGLQSRCKRCHADALHNLSVERRQQMLEQQDGRCLCGTVFDIHGGIGSTYRVDHDHGCCPRETSCGNCVRALVCQSCNMRDINNPNRTGYKGSKHRGVHWHGPTQKWRINISRNGKQFSPTVINLTCGYTDEDEAGAVARKLEAHLDAHPGLWR